MRTRKTRSHKQPNNLILDLRPVNKSQSRKNLSRIIPLKDRRFIYGAITVIAVFIVFWVLSTLRHASERLSLGEAKARIGSHMILPTNEQPTFVVVEDNKKVKDAFIASKAENGDVILIYPVNQIAIIYRPSVNKIVATGNLFADPALAEADGATITVLNGTNDESKTKSIITEIETLYPKANVTDGGKANRQDFATTIIIDNSQKKDYLTDAIAQRINGKRGIVPISESITTTDLMIIVGKD